MANQLPTPTCTHHQTTDIQCLNCRGPMRLVTIEPGSTHFDMRTYACTGCDITESFLMAIVQPRGQDPGPIVLDQRLVQARAAEDCGHAA